MIEVFNDNFDMQIDRQGKKRDTIYFILKLESFYDNEGIESFLSYVNPLWLFNDQRIAWRSMEKKIHVHIVSKDPEK